MDNFVITGGSKLKGEVTIGGAKNVALKTLVASILTDDEISIENVPNIADVELMVELLESLGVTAKRTGHQITIAGRSITSTTVPLEIGARLRASSMMLAPLLSRFGEAKIPNPGGCRIGARPIDRHIDGLVAMGATITYNHNDGYFYAKAKRLRGVTYKFPKNTHTGTETLMIAATLADGTTILENAASEVEVDDLIAFLNLMGANIKRTKPREIVIVGVSKLHGVRFRIMPDRNEEVTFAVGALITHGDVVVTGSQLNHLTAFTEVYQKAGGRIEHVSDTKTRYFGNNTILPTDIVTTPHPGFMTDWQAPWAVLMTQASGISTIHETVFESRFSYVSELKKMGAVIDFYDPVVVNPGDFYNFNWADRVNGYHQGIRITGPTKLHNAILQIDDLRAGATLVLAALAAEGESYIGRVEQIDRGYEKIEERLLALGARIKRIES